jgi:MFS superfamily sulfate permease-like transporter
MKITNVVLIGILLSTFLFAQRDRRMEDRNGDDRRGRMEMYAIWKLTENLDLDEKQAEVFFPKLNSHKSKMEEMGKERRDVWEDIVLKARKGEKVTDKELETARNKSKGLDKKINAEKEKFANGLGDVLTNEQQVLFHIFGREMVSDAKEQMRDHRERRKDMGGYKKKRKRW